jgi:hypothetical protein
MKSRSNATRTHFCLFGTAELADILFQSGAISKRVRPIWLDTYELGRQKDMREFRKGVNGLFQKLTELSDFEIKCNIDLNSRISYIANRTVGVFGLANEWVERVLIRCIATGSHTISWANMLPQQIDDAQLQGVIGDLIRYRSVRDEIKEKLKERMSILLAPAQSTDQLTATTASPTSKAHAKPGVRKPCRDKVGT